MKTTTLLVLAAGMGSRYKGQKQIDGLTAQNEVLMEFALYDAFKIGIQKFVFIINNQFPEVFKTKLTEICTAQEKEIHFVVQTLTKFIPEEFHAKIADRKKPLGTAHAVYCAKEIIQEPFITMNADDFYGKETFQTAMNYIQDNKINSAHFAMVAFELKNTLSPSGAVSRGVCQVKNTQLKSVDEHTNIQQIEADIVGLNEAMQEKKLPPTTLVSMNFWVLHPSFFNMAEKEISAFLSIQKENSKAECYLPTVIDKNIQDQKLQVEVLSSSEKWIGLTYPGDKARVVAEIALQKKTGVYPTNLWI